MPDPMLGWGTDDPVVSLSLERLALTASYQCAQDSGRRSVIGVEPVSSSQEAPADGEA